jgi:hypothetical protein
LPGGALRSSTNSAASCSASSLSTESNSRLKFSETSTWTPTGSRKPRRANCPWRKGRTRWSHSRRSRSSAPNARRSRHSRRSSRIRREQKGQSWLSRKDAQSAERRFAWTVQLTKRITNVFFALSPSARFSLGGGGSRNYPNAAGTLLTQENGFQRLFSVVTSTLWLNVRSRRALIWERLAS